MNAQKTNAEKINNRYLYAINSIAKLTTCYYIFEGGICAVSIESKLRWVHPMSSTAPYT